MKWIHIMDQQPQHGRRIIQADPPYQNNYHLGIREYVMYCSFEAWMKNCEIFDIPKPNFFWMYEEDFPFPDKQEKPIDPCPY